MSTMTRLDGPISIGLPAENKIADRWDEGFPSIRVRTNTIYACVADCVTVTYQYWSVQHSQNIIYLHGNIDSHQPKHTTSTVRHV